MSFVTDLADALLAGVYRRFDRLDERYDHIAHVLQSLKRAEEQQMATLADIRTEVEQQQTVIASAVTLMQQLKQMLTDAIASNDPAAMQEIVDLLNAGEQSLADAVVANTPAAPNP